MLRLVDLNMWSDRGPSTQKQFLRANFNQGSSTSSSHSFPCLGLPLAPRLLSKYRYLNSSLSHQESLLISDLGYSEVESDCPRTNGGKITSRSTGAAAQGALLYLGLRWLLSASHWSGGLPLSPSTCCHGKGSGLWRFPTLSCPFTPSKTSSLSFLFFQIKRVFLAYLLPPENPVVHQAELQCSGMTQTTEIKKKTKKTKNLSGCLDASIH